ncbi:hypothetical protein J6590_060329 [Homalodisca vitripennis]|nr:hypothetical protein J6590_060329 [Homalodisca vitripennis]
MTNLWSNRISDVVLGLSQGLDYQSKSFDVSFILNESEWFLVTHQLTIPTRETRPIGFTLVVAGVKAVVQYNAHVAAPAAVRGWMLPATFTGRRGEKEAQNNGARALFGNSDYYLLNSPLYLISTRDCLRSVGLLLLKKAQPATRTPHATHVFAICPRARH